MDNIVLFKTMTDKIFKTYYSKSENKNEKKKIVHNNSRRIYSTLLNIYYNDYKNTPDEEKGRMGTKYYPKKLLNRGKKMKRKVSHSHKKPLLKE